MWNVVEKETEISERVIVHSIGLDGRIWAWKKIKDCTFLCLWIYGLRVSQLTDAKNLLVKHKYPEE